ncbi:uncharacterized protein GIQ15_04309 [Arthroderma uncinatum]|uniref:uncharacterized protein n=1 Tax=Arthroderma uncinatum TaxID=74035 RepID=UPI00144A6178|nr:uncharacterized protein GIQ15_04309 [Arthroderma uncinatum]KAF3481550.1 hypothetical protein GIQ15_04309 [Arthroderma uncinatum]
MRSSEDCAWFKLVRSGNHPRLRYDGRLRSIFERLDSPHIKFPSLAMFMGRGAKDRALRQIFQQYISAQGPHTNLRVDSRTESSSYPVLFADCDPHVCHLGAENSSPALRPIPWATARDTDVQDIFLTRLAFLFTDVVFLFAEDVGGMDGVKTLLTAWATFGSASSLTPRPGVIVVAVSDGASVTHDMLEEGQFLADLAQHAGVADTFMSVDIVYLPPAGASTVEPYQGLRDEMLKRLDLARRHRREHRSLFSAIHFGALFEEAMDQRCRSRYLGFDFIDASQKGRETDGRYPRHLTTFLSLGAESDTAIQGSLIASSMLMDAYPSRAHWFEPQTAFRTLYRGPCTKALREVHHSLGADDRCRQIEACFVGFFGQLAAGGGPARKIHLRNLSRHRRWLSDIRTEAVCLCCLSRFPHHSTPCHSVCDVCVEAFGEPVKRKELQYELGSCLICKAPERLRVDLVPRTATIRGLALDGGGVRGVLQLRKLMQLEEALGGGLPIQWLVDVVSGSSIAFSRLPAGGINGIDLIVLGLPVTECTKNSIGLLKQVFEKSPKSRWWLVSLPSRVVGCWVKDGVYGPAVLDSVLQRHYEERSIFGRTAFSSIRLLVTALTTSDQLVVLSNRKAGEHAQADNGYLHLDPSRPAPLLWQCARATSAAPGFFPPINLPGVGDCQDGALKCPNPAALCRSETPRMWPWEPELGVLLSIGTGVGVSASTGGAAPPSQDGQGAEDTSDGSPARRAKDKFPFRLFRRLMSSMDGGAAWLELMSQLDRETREYCFRLDTLIPGEVPPLDSVESVDGLMKLADEQELGMVGLKALKALLAASFYLRLSEPPRREDTYFRCVAVVRCRLDNVRVGVDAITRLYGPSVELIIGGERVGFPTSENAACCLCRRYCLPVRFTVRDLGEPLRPALGVAGAPEEQFVRLGPPRSASWYRERQEIGSAFGATGHHSRTATDCEACQLKISGKRALSLSRPGTGKRVRFSD